ncbi:MAG: hypothetical protein Kow0080_25810 [Candidatus Promineifilaceae bacterium]
MLKYEREFDSFLLLLENDKKFMLHSPIQSEKEKESNGSEWEESTIGGKSV